MDSKELQSKLVSITGESVQGSSNYTKQTILQKGLAHFIKAFAWYVAVLVAIVGIALSLGTVLNIDITSRAFILDMALLLGGSIFVYFSFLVDGRESGKNSEQYKEVLQNYNNTRKGLTLLQVQEHLHDLAFKQKQEFIDMVCKRYGTPYDILYKMPAEQLKQHYRRKDRQLIIRLQKRDYPNMYPKDATKVLYAVQDNITIKGKINLNASRDYIVKQSVLKILTSILLATISSSIIINLTDKSITSIIFSIGMLLVTIGTSIVTGKRSGYNSIVNYKAGVLAYCSDLLSGIKEIEK